MEADNGNFQMVTYGRVGEMMTIAFGILGGFLLIMLLLAAVRALPMILLILAVLGIYLYSITPSDPPAGTPPSISAHQQTTRP